MADLAPKMDTNLFARSPIVEPLPAGLQVASNGLGFLGALGDRKAELERGDGKPSISERERQDKQRFYTALDEGVQMMEQGYTDKGVQHITKNYRDFVRVYGREEEDVNNAFSDATGFSTNVEVTGTALQEGEIANTESFTASLSLAMAQNPEATEDELYAIAMEKEKSRLATETKLEEIYQKEKVEWFEAEPVLVEKARQAGDIFMTGIAGAQADSIITPDEARQIREQWHAFYGGMRKPSGVDQERWDKYQEEYITPLNKMVDSAVGLALNNNFNSDVSRAYQGIISKAVMQGKLPNTVLAAFTPDKDGSWTTVMNIMEEEAESGGRWSESYNILNTGNFEELMAWVTEYEYKTSVDELNLDPTEFKSLPNQEKLEAIIEGGVSVQATLNDPGKTAAYINALNQEFAALEGDAVTVTAYNNVFSPAYFEALKVAYEANPVIGEQLIRGSIESINSQRVAVAGAIQSTASQAGLYIDGGVVRPTEETLTRIQPTLDLYFNGDWNTAVEMGGKNSDGILQAPVHGIIKAARDEVLPLMQRMQAADNKIDILMEGLPKETTRNETPVSTKPTQPSNPITIPTKVAEDTGFVQEVETLATDLGIPSEWIMRVIAKESGFNPSIPNAEGSGAMGLIQFMPFTARELGTTTAELKGMSRVEQMVYVRKYLEPKLRGVENPTFSDLYMAVLYPVAIGKSDNYILFKKGTKAYEQNSGLDLNGDGVVRKGEAAQWAWGSDTLPYSEGIPSEAAAPDTSARPTERPSDLETGTTATVSGDTVGGTQPVEPPPPTSEASTPAQGGSQEGSGGGRTASAVATERLERATLQQLRDSGGNIKNEFNSTEEFSTALKNGEVETGDLVMVEGIPMVVQGEPQ